MAVATHSSTATEPARMARATLPHTRRHAPVTPGKVAMWLFLATEVMFFTGLIGSYIVLRAGSTHTAYSNLYSPATPLKGLDNTHGVVLDVGWRRRRGGRASSFETDGGLTAEQAEDVVHAVPHGLVSGLDEKKADGPDRPARGGRCVGRGRTAQDVQLAAAVRRA